MHFLNVCISIIFSEFLKLSVAVPSPLSPYDSRVHSKTKLEGRKNNNKKNESLDPLLFVLLLHASHFLHFFYLCCSSFLILLLYFVFLVPVIVTFWLLLLSLLLLWVHSLSVSRLVIIRHQHILMGFGYTVQPIHE